MYINTMILCSYSTILYFCVCFDGFDGVFLLYVLCILAFFLTTRKDIPYINCSIDVIIFVFAGNSYIVLSRL